MQGANTSPIQNPKDKRELYFQNSLPSSSYIQGIDGGLYRINTAYNRYYVDTYAYLKRETKDEVNSKEQKPSMQGTHSSPNGDSKDKRALYFEDSSYVRLIDGSISRGPILANGYVSTHGHLYANQPMYTSRYFVRNPVSYVTYNTRGIKDQKDGDEFATTMESSTEVSPRPFQSIDGQSGEETSTFRTHIRPQVGTSSAELFGNKNQHGGSSEELNSQFPEKQQKPRETMPVIPDTIKQQNGKDTVQGVKQPINEAEKSRNWNGSLFG